MDVFSCSALEKLSLRKTTTIFCIVLAILILENGIAEGRSVNQSRQRKSDSEENDSPGNSALERKTDLITLIENEFQLDAHNNYNENSEGVGVKRKGRSPLDEDTDEDADDSDEDDDEEEDNEKNGNKNDTEKLKKDTLPTTTLPPGTSQISKSNLTVVPLPPTHKKFSTFDSESPAEKAGELHLPSDYNNLVIPKIDLLKGTGIEFYSAVPVWVTLNIRSVRDIDETIETITLDLDLLIEWLDGFIFDWRKRRNLNESGITLNPIFLKKIWRPDIYMDEIVKVKHETLMSKPLKLTFNPISGKFTYTTRLIVQLSCDMIYTYYPADTQSCEFTFRSYSYLHKDLSLRWRTPGVYLQDPSDSNFDLQVKSIDRVELPQRFHNLTNDTYDGLRFTLLARRKLSFHLVQTYLPSVFFIVITWLCFLIPARMIEARIGISMTTLLTLTAMFSSVRESTPTVSYVKAIDTWMVVCIFFVFLTLFEFATLVWLRSRREHAEEQKLEHQLTVQEKNGKEGEDAEVTFTRSSSLASVKLHKYEWFAEFTEKYAFIIFSIVFTIFTVSYWSWLLVSSDYFDWSVNATLNAVLNLE